ncbi:MAG: zinc-ribbon domain-containing protein [Acidobacteriota bacterium]
MIGEKDPMPRNCPSCGNEIKPDATVCSECGAQLDPLTSAEVEEAREEPDTREANSRTIRVDPEDAAAAQPQAPPQPKEPSRNPPVEAASPQPTVIVEPSDEVPPPKGPASDDGLGPEELDALNAFAEGKRIVTVIGFPGSGKTFFVNRLRHDLSKALWRCKPAPDPEIVQNPFGLQLTRLVPLKSRVNKLNYLLVDLAGESFQKALEAGFRTGQIASFSARSYLSAVAFASAYILVIPLEDLAGVEDGREGREVDWARGLMDNFHSILGCIVTCANKLAQGESPKALLDRGLSAAELKTAFEGKLRCDRPICVLFSLADRFLGTLDPADQEVYDYDPVLYAAERIPKLFNPIWDAFSYFRFDYMSSFWGHGKSLKVDYRQKSHGAIPAFLWIHDLLDRGRMSRLSRSRLSTRQAIQLRRLVDREFRLTLNNIEGRSKWGVNT